MLALERSLILDFQKQRSSREEIRMNLFKTHDKKSDVSVPLDASQPTALNQQQPTPGREL